jgi:hypothetical protein
LKLHGQQTHAGRPGEINLQINQLRWHLGASQGGIALE